MAAVTSPAELARSVQSSVISGVFVGIAFLFVALRMYTRAFIVRNIGPEDWTIVLSWICGLLMAIAICMEGKYGNGQHIQDVSPENLHNFLRALYFSIIPYQTSLVLTKMSILLQYHRIFPGKKMRLAIYILMGITLAYAFWSIFNNAFMCNPVRGFWDLSVPRSRCLPQALVWYSNAALNIATDIVIFLLPMPALRQLQLPRKQKIGLMIVFALGGFVCLISVVRLPQLYALIRSRDPTWDNANIAYWCGIEVGVSIICACVPTLKAFAAKHMPRLIGQSAGGYGGEGEYTSGKRATATHAGGVGGNATLVGVGEGKVDDEYVNRIQVVTVVEQGREDADGASLEKGVSRDSDSDERRV